MAKNKFSKYVTYASLDLPDDVNETLNILDRVKDGDIKVLYPLSVNYAGRSFKVRCSNELIIFYNAVECTVDVAQQKPTYQVTFTEESVKTWTNSLSEKFGPIKEDYFYLPEESRSHYYHY